MPRLGRGALEHAQSYTGDKKRGKRPQWLDRVDVQDFLEKAEVNNVQRATADEIKCSCPFPGHTHGDTDPSLYMNTGEKNSALTTVFKCHGCGRSGNAITFYAELENISKQDAAHRLRDEYAPDFRKPRDGIRAEFEKWLSDRHKREEERRHQHEVPVIGWDSYNQFDVDWPSFEDDDSPEVRYLLDRGFAVRTLQHWRIGWDGISERLTIPVCNPEGELVGVKARTWKPKKREKIKYKILGDKNPKRRRYGFDPYEKSMVVFGAHEIPAGTKTVVLCEGELDVIALWQIGIPALSTGSASVSKLQSQIIRSLCDEVVLFFDSDNAGKHGMFGFLNKDGEWKPGLVERLEPFVRVRIVKAHDEDPADMVKAKKVLKLRRMIATAVSSYSAEGRAMIALSKDEQLEQAQSK